MAIAQSWKYFRFLARYLRAYRVAVVGLTVLLAAATGLQLLNPLVLRRFIDSFGDASGLQTALVAGSVFLVVGLIAQAVQGLTSYLGTDLAWRATNRVRSEMLSHILQQDMSFHTSHVQGELVQRVDGDVTILANFFSQFIIRLVGGILLALGVLVVLATEDMRIALAFGGFMAFFLVVHTLGQRLAVPHWRMNRAATAEFSGYLGERIAGLKDIQTNFGGYSVSCWLSSDDRPFPSRGLCVLSRLNQDLSL